jgi:hypothetical protein
MANHHQNNKHREQKKNIEVCKREKKITYKGKPNIRFLNGNLKSKKGME